MFVKRLIATAAVTVTAATCTGPASAGPTKATVKWTPAQLQQLATAYHEKNPGWRAPMSSGLRLPAEVTWTAENLDRLAAAYAALNPGWTRPAGGQTP
jgi:hypothetical protein